MVLVHQEVQEIQELVVQVSSSGANELSNFRYIRIQEIQELWFISSSEIQLVVSKQFQVD
jgi:hypothetical protein